MLNGVPVLGSKRPPFEFLDQSSKFVGYASGLVGLVIEHHHRRFTIGGDRLMEIAPNHVRHCHTAAPDACNTGSNDDVVRILDLLTIVAADRGQDWPNVCARSQFAGVLVAQPDALEVRDASGLKPTKIDDVVHMAEGILVAPLHGQPNEGREQCKLRRRIGDVHQEVPGIRVPRDVCAGRFNVPRGMPSRQAATPVPAGYNATMYSWYSISRSHKRSVSAFGATALLWLAASVASAGTIVLANRTMETISFQLAGQDCKVPPGEVLPIRAEMSQTLRFSGSVRPYYTVDPNAVYFFGPAPPSRIELVQIGLGGDATSSRLFESDLLAPGPNSTLQASGLVTTIPVKVLVDEDEAATRDNWEQRIRNRITEASAIFERHCFVRFEVVAVATWKSNDENSSFEQSLVEFEREISPHPARLAIGFTSQYRVMLGRTHLGGTRGPMHSHLLVREWSNRISEAERLEVLVHELGHFLGAVHSPEKDSVMRAVLGDKQARAVGFRIGFDPVNALAMSLVSEAMHNSRVNRFSEMRLATQLELCKLYGEIARTDPSDKTPAQYVGILENATIQPLLHGTKLVLIGMGRSAASKDELTELYIRRAAAVAERLAGSVGPRAFLLGIGLGLDRTSALREHRLIGPFYELIETNPQREARLNLLGVPTAYDKHELARHFLIAAALTAVVGVESAERACLAFQLGDSMKPGDFSPEMYQADLAGIVFAHRIVSGELSLQDVAKQFVVAGHLPHFDNIEVLASPADFKDRYGSVADPRFRKLRAELGAPIRRLVEQKVRAGRQP